MQIHRDGKVIHDSELTKDKSPDLINGDTVTLNDFECFFTRIPAIFDVVETKALTEDQAKEAILSTVNPGCSFVAKNHER